MSFLHDLIGGYADLLSDEPVLVGSGISGASLAAASALNLPGAYIWVIQIALVVFIATAIRHAVTPKGNVDFYEELLSEIGLGITTGPTPAPTPTPVPAPPAPPVPAPVAVPHEPNAAIGNQ